MLSENQIELSGIKTKEEKFSKSKGGNVYQRYLLFIAVSPTNTNVTSFSSSDREYCPINRLKLQTRIY